MPVEIAPENLTPVLVEWEDSYCSTGWRFLAEMEPEVMRCRSLGWVVSQDDDCLVLAPHVSAEDHGDAPLQGNGIMVIPKRAITSVEPVKKDRAGGAPSPVARDGAATEPSSCSAAAYCPELA